VGVSIGSLGVALVADSNPFATQMKKAERAVKKLASPVAKLGRTLRTKLGAGLNSAVGKLAVFGGGLLSAGAAIAKFNQMRARLDMLAKTARNLGMTAQSLAELEYAAQRSGMEVSVLHDSMRSFTKILSEAALGMGPGVEALDKLGLSAAELKAQSPDQQINTLADALRGINDPGEQARIAMVLFGEAGFKMLDMLRQGSSGIMEMRSRFTELFGDLSTDLPSIEEFNDAMLDTQTAFDGVAMKLTVELMPALQSLAKWLIHCIEWWKSLGQVIDDLLAKLRDMNPLLKGAIKAGASIIPGGQVALEGLDLLAQEAEGAEKRVKRLNREQLERQRINDLNRKSIQIEKEKATLATDHAAQINRANKLTESLTTKAQQYQQQLAEINQLEAGGFFDKLDPERNAELAEQLRVKLEAQVQSDIDAIIDAQAAKEKARLDAWEKAADNAAQKATTNLVRFGTKEFFEAQAREQFKKDNPLVEFQKDSLKVQDDQLDVLEQIRDKIKPSKGGGGNNLAGNNLIEVGLA
jgi:hypothetical protein